MAMTAKLWTVTGLASELGRDRRTISGALRDVPPDGKSGRFDAWYLTTAIRALSGSGDDRFDLTAERARLAAAQAERVERQNAVEAGEFIRVASFNRMATAAFLIVRGRLLGIAPRLAPLWSAKATAAEAQEILRKEIYATLDELAATDFAKYDHSNEFANTTIADLLHGELETTEG